MKSLISTAKASGAMKKFLPSAVTGKFFSKRFTWKLFFDILVSMNVFPGTIVKQDIEEANDSELEKVEKRYVK